jgi:hypothetical protein
VPVGRGVCVGAVVGGGVAVGFGAVVGGGVGLVVGAVVGGAVGTGVGWAVGPAGAGVPPAGPGVPLGLTAVVVLEGVGVAAGLAEAGPEGGGELGCCDAGAEAEAEPDA